MATDSAIGVRVKELRESAKETQRELAIALNLELRTYGSYERGERKFPVDILVKIANRYGATVDSLVQDETADALQYDGDIISYREAAKNNPDLRILFSAARNVSKEDLQTTIRILQGFKKTSKE